MTDAMQAGYVLASLVPTLAVRITDDLRTHLDVSSQLNDPSVTEEVRRRSVAPTTQNRQSLGSWVAASLKAMPYDPIVPEGQHLGASRNVEGAVTGHLFEDGTNDLKGHAAWQWVDEPDDYEPPRQLTTEEREMREKLAAMIVVGVIIGVQAAAPHMKRWWNEKVVPGVSATWDRLTGRRRGSTRDVEARDSTLVDRATFAASARGTEVAITNAKISMTSAEWSDRYRAMLIAGDFKDEQMRILANARIDDGSGDELEGHRAQEQLTPQQFVDSIKRMIEANPSVLDDETVAELVRVFDPPPDAETGALEK